MSVCLPAYLSVDLFVSWFVCVRACVLVYVFFGLSVCVSPQLLYVILVVCVCSSVSLYVSLCLVCLYLSLYVCLLLSLSSFPVCLFLPCPAQPCPVQFNWPCIFDLPVFCFVPSPVPVLFCPAPASEVSQSFSKFPKSSVSESFAPALFETSFAVHWAPSCFCFVFLWDVWEPSL